MNAAELRAAFTLLRSRFEAEEARLAALDAQVGDGDHGAAMVRGFRSAAAAAKEASGEDVGAVLVQAAKAFMRATGGASGPLFASVFLELGRASRGRDELDTARVHAGLAHAVHLVKRMGHVEVGDKTLLDALAPAADALDEAAERGAPLPEALAEAAEAAAAGRDATEAMAAVRGRAHWVEGEGRGTADPGATSMAIVFDAWAAAARGDGAIAPNPDEAALAPHPDGDDASSHGDASSSTAGGSVAPSTRAEHAEPGGSRSSRSHTHNPGTKLLNDPADAVDEMLTGYVAAYGDIVSRTPGRRIVTRAQPKPPGRVGLAIGNGTGHEPIAMGWVGHGMLDTNALGEIFTAPSPDLIAEAIAAADYGAGVILLISQHAGDVINGEMGAELARDAGVNARSLLMYDDVASAPKGRERERRGAPGTAFVYKVVGARAEEGANIDELLALGERVRDGTRTLSVAVAPGTSPITGKPMFTLPEGEWFIGMGVHGEPGLKRMDAAPVADVVRVMVDALIEDGDFSEGERVLAFVNGSGGTTLMELLIAYRAVDAILRQRGVEVHRPLVGEYVTTQETKGFSISLCRADEEIARLWDAPARVPYFHR